MDEETPKKSINTGGYAVGTMTSNATLTNGFNRKSVSVTKVENGYVINFHNTSIVGNTQYIAKLQDEMNQIINDYFKD